jgi:DNA-binding response OmpR family regulator
VKIDIVFLDLNVRDSNGIDTYIKIKELRMMMPVIVLTGLDDKEIALKGNSGGGHRNIF